MVESNDTLGEFMFSEVQSKTITKDVLEKAKESIKSLSIKNETSISNSNKQYDLVIVTALKDPEMDALKKLPVKWNKVNIRDDDCIYEECIFEKDNKKFKVIAGCCNAMGMSAAASLSMKMINLFKPRYVAMVGIAAGIKGQANFGDILIADESWDWGSGKIKDGVDGNGDVVFETSSRHMTLERRLINKFIEFNSEKRYLIDNIQNNLIELCDGNVKLNVQIGPIVSGSAVLASESYVNRIKIQNRKIVGIDMEIYSVFCSVEYASNPKPQVFCIKSVSDLGDKDKDDKHRYYAARTSAFYLYNFVLDQLD
jgi:nucleoside phosphorylase